MNRATRLALLLLLAPAAASAAMPLAIQAGVLYPVSGPPVRDALILIRDGRITFVGPAADRMISADHQIISAAVVTPGLIDGRATVGLSGLLNQPHDQDMLERSAPVQPELRAIDAYNGGDPLVAWVRSLGVTTVNTGHSPGALVSGQTMVVKTSGGARDREVLQPAAFITAALGGAGVNRAEGKAPGTRAKAIALLRSELIKAQEYVRKRALTDETKRPARDLRLEALGRALEALRLAKEFNLQIVLDGCADAPLVLEELRAAGFPVIIHPTMARAGDDTENLAMDTAAKLAAAGIPFTLQSGYESYVPKTRVVLFEAAVAAGRGLGLERALASVTLDAARILGVADRIGTVEVGKDADLALFDGDPFEYTTHVTATVINGELFRDGPR